MQLFHLYVDISYGMFHILIFALILDAEISAQKFMESAQLAEMDFNKKYVLFACHHPEELLKQVRTHFKSLLSDKGSVPFFLNQGNFGNEKRNRKEGYAN